MATFSERIGITSTRMEIQRDRMDDPLRNSLWNVVYTMLETPLNGRFEDAHRECRELFETMWSAFLKQPVHEINNFRSERLIATLREPFLIVWPWWKVYDFIEFLPTAFRGARHYTPERGGELRSYLNVVLEREMSAYRFVGAQLTEVTDAVEIEAVGHAVNTTQPEPWTALLRSALGYLTDRDGPDHARSLRDSTLAVEAVARQLTGRDDATVEDLLALIDVRPSVREAMSTLFGSSADASVWRGGNGTHRPPDFADAKLMLVAASSFVHYALHKVSTEEAARAATHEPPAVTPTVTRPRGRSESTR